MSSASYQKFIIVGNVGRDAETRELPSGGSVTSFSVAVSEKYKGEESTMWIKVNTFSKLAEICGQYVKKGMSVLVEGRIMFDPATGNPKVFAKKDGSPSSSFEILANEVKFLGGKKEAQEEAPVEIPF